MKVSGSYGQHYLDKKKWNRTEETVLECHIYVVEKWCDFLRWPNFNWNVLPRKARELLFWSYLEIISSETDIKIETFMSTSKIYLCGLEYIKPSGF